MKNLKLPLTFISGSKNTGSGCAAHSIIRDAGGDTICEASGNEGVMRLADIAGICNQHAELVERKQALEVKCDLLAASLKQADETAAYLERQLGSQRIVIRAHQVLITDLESRLAKLVDGNQTLIDDQADARRGQEQVKRILVNALQAIATGAQRGEQLAVLETLAVQALDDVGPV